MSAAKSNFSPGLAIAILSCCSALSGCATSSGPSLSDMDRVFISAAETWDFDRNGAVSCEDWNAYLKRRFDEGDVNRDRNLNAEEFPSLAQSDRLFAYAKFDYWEDRKSVV